MSIGRILGAFVVASLLSACAGVEDEGEGFGGQGKADLSASDSVYHLTTLWMEEPRFIDSDEAYFVLPASELPEVFIGRYTQRDIFVELFVASTPSATDAVLTPFSSQEYESGPAGMTFTTHVRLPAVSPEQFYIIKVKSERNFQFLVRPVGGDYFQNLRPIRDSELDALGDTTFPFPRALELEPGQDYVVRVNVRQGARNSRMRFYRMPMLATEGHFPFWPGTQDIEVLQDLPFGRDGIEVEYAFTAEEDYVVLPRAVWFDDTRYGWGYDLGGQTVICRGSCSQ